MTGLIGELLPLSVGVAISPVPIIAAILMLLSPQARGTSVGFLLGWVVGITAATTIVALLAGTLSTQDQEPSATASWIKIGLGVALVVLAVHQWRGRPRPGDNAPLPKWMSAIDAMTFGKALGMGVALSAINPKNLIMCISAGVAIGAAALGSGASIGAGAVFVVLASSTVAVPVVGYLLAADRMRGPLDELKGWLQQNNTAVMSVLLLVIGVASIGKGLGSL